MGLIFSKSRAAFTFAAIGAAGAGSGALRYEVIAFAQARSGAAQQIATLEARALALAGCDDAGVARARLRARTFLSGIGEEATWDRVSHTLGARWTPDGVSRVDRGSYCVRTGTFNLRMPLVTDWPGVVEAVGQLEAIAGVAVCSVEVHAGASSPSAGLDLVRISVEVRSRAAAGASL